MLWGGRGQESDTCHPRLLAAVLGGGQPAAWPRTLLLARAACQAGGQVVSLADPSLMDLPLLLGPWGTGLRTQSLPPSKSPWSGL